MHKHTLIVGALMTLLAACSDEPTPPGAPTTAATQTRNAPADMRYPIAKTVVQNDDYHGTTVSDPYRWMEDLDAPDLHAWIEAENALVEDYLHDAPGRAEIKSRLTALWNTERFGVPEKHGNNYFYARNDGLQNQSPIYVQEGIDGTPRLLLDPNTLSTDATIALAEVGISADGKNYAYSLSDGGSDWRTIRFRDVVTGTDRNDEIHWAKFTNIAWAHDASGIYYSGYDAPSGENQLKAINKFQKVYFHQLGTPQTTDRLVFERKDQPDWGFSATVSDDGHYLIITGSEGTDERNRVFIQDLTQAHSPVTALIEPLEASYGFIGNVEDRLYFRTDADAERHHRQRIDLQTNAQVHHQRVAELGDQYQRQHDADRRHRTAEAQQTHQEHGAIEQVEHAVFDMANFVIDRGHDADVAGSNPQVDFVGPKRSDVQRVAERVAEILSEFKGLILLGPAPALIERNREGFRWKLMVKSAKHTDATGKLLHQAARHIQQRFTHKTVRMSIDVDPARTTA